MFCAITSCTRKIEFAVTRTAPGGIILNLHVHTSGRDVRAVSPYPDEDEVILLPYAKFTVLDNLREGPQGRYVINLMEVRPEQWTS